MHLQVGIPTNAALAVGALVAAAVAGGRARAWRSSVWQWFSATDDEGSGEERSRQLTQALLDFLTILVGALEIFFATCVFVYISRMENRTPAPLGETVGAHKAVLAKLRKGESMSQDEMDYAEELISDSRSPLAYAIPAALFTMGLFYVVGCFQQLHGAAPSFRTYVGVIPMFTSTNMAIQLRRVAHLKGRLRNAALTAPQSSAELTSA